MILIDTSVWIEFLKQKESFVRVMKMLLEAQKVITIEPVFSELLFGVRNNQEEEMILSYWHVLPKIEFGTGTMLAAAQYACKEDYQQRGIGLIDAILIKSVIDGNHLIWTLDQRITSNLDQKYVYANS
jgi:predicted nucleic acid-binding protein